MNPRPAIAHRCYPTEHGHQHPSTYGHLWLYRRHRPYHLAWSACTQVPVHNMNLTRSIVADNVVYRIETYYLPKSEALALDISTTRKVCSNDHSPWRSWSACCHGLSCGPLPVGPRTAIRPLKEIYHREDIPYNARSFGDIGELLLFLARELAPIAHAMEVSMHSRVNYLLNSSLSPQELFGVVVRRYENDTFMAGFIGPFSYDGSFRGLWMTWRRNTAGSYSSSQFLQLRVIGRSSRYLLSLLFT